MTRQLDPATREALLARVRFYRDLGLTEFYRRPVDQVDSGVPEPADAPSLASEAWESADPGVEPVRPLRAPSIPLPSAEWAGDQDPEHNPQEDSPIASRKPFPAAPQISDEILPANRAAALQLIRDDIGDCTRCTLHMGRNKLVFGDGNPAARLLFVGEGPGADEDAQGIPFVGRAGQLLNNMISAMGLKREDVYIANIVKCRPPGNRTPEPDEANTCSPFLFRQIDVVRPEVLVALGATAATYLLGQRQPLAGLRGRVHSFRGTKLIVTYHPAFLLRDPRQKKEAWADLQIAMRELGLNKPR